MSKLEKHEYKLTWNSALGINHEEAYETINTLSGTINDLIDLVNSQQEAIEKLESKVWTADFIKKYRPALENLAKADDTHRTVTLRIPKGMKLSLAIYLAFKNDEAYHKVSLLDWLLDQSDTDLQKALDEVEE